MSSFIQDDLPLESIKAHTVFPGRSVLLVQEVAIAFRVTDQHILDLIEEGEIFAVDLQGRQKVKPSDLGNLSARRLLRIPVAEYDRFIGKRSTVK